MSKLGENPSETNYNNENSQTVIRCCDNLPSFTITYDVAGVFVVYSVCTLCSKLDCFSHFIVEKVLIQNENGEIKNDCENIEQNEITEDIIEDASENTEHHAVNAEHTEQTTSIALVSDKGEN